MTSQPSVVVLQHDPQDPPMLVETWLAERDVALDVRRLHDGDPQPESARGLAGLISMGGGMAAWDDDLAPWLPASRALLADAVRHRVPTLGICLGGQLLAAATGGSITRGADGPELGAYLTARRDAAEMDPLLRDIPLTPDVMHFHQDVIDVLPPGAVLLLSSPGYPHQAFRIGSAAWGTQFHFEATAETLRDWGRLHDLPVEDLPRFGARLDEAEEFMGEVWRDIVHRFAGLVHEHAGSAGPELVRRRLPLDGSG